MKKSFFVTLCLFTLLIVSLPVTALANEEFDRAVEKYGQGRFQEAIEILTVYVEKNPEPAAYWLIGYSFYKLKRFDEADEYFKSAYLIDPDFSPKQIAAFAPGIEELEKGILKRLEEEFEREVTVPEEGPPEIPTFEIKPHEAPTEGPAGTEQGVGVQREAASIEEPQQAVQEQPPAQQEAKPQLQESAPPAVASPQVQPPVSQPYQPRVMPQRDRQQMPGPEGMAAITMLFAGFGLIALILSAVFYLYFSLCFFLMAKKLDIPAPWLAFIPIVQIWTFVAVAGKPWWWILLLFIPIVGAILGIYLWMCISENMGKNKWLGLLILVPIINFILPGYLAFSRSETTELIGGGGAESPGFDEEF